MTRSGSSRKARCFSFLSDLWTRRPVTPALITSTHTSPWCACNAFFSWLDQIASLLDTSLQEFVEPAKTKMIRSISGGFRSACSGPRNQSDLIVTACSYRSGSHQTSTRTSRKLLHGPTTIESSNDRSLHIASKNECVHLLRSCSRALV